MDYKVENKNPFINTSMLFREVQKMDQKWVWIIVLIPVITSWYGAYQQLVLGNPFGDNPSPDWIVLLVFMGFGILFPFFFYSLKLITEVREDGIYFRFFPFHLSFKKLPFKNIERYEVRTYSPIKDYGGWGIRYGLKGKAYTTSGNRGVLLEFTDGEKTKTIMLGSKMPETLFQAIRKGTERQAHT
ncbi:MAG: DUF6141 family protein [Methanosarcina sp.]